MSDNGNLILENRSKLSVSAVSDVESFDDKKIVLKTGDCRLTIMGSGLKLSHVNVEEGEAVVTGFVDSCVYSGASKGGVWRRLVK